MTVWVGFAMVCVWAYIILVCIRTLTWVSSLHHCKEGRSPFINNDEESEDDVDRDPAENTSDFAIRSTLIRSFSESQAAEEKSLQELRALASRMEDETLVDSQPGAAAMEGLMQIESQWRVEEDPVAPSPPNEPPPEATPEADKKQFEVLFQMVLRKQKQMEKLGLD